MLSENNQSNSIDLEIKKYEYLKLRYSTSVFFSTLTPFSLTLWNSFASYEEVSRDILGKLPSENILP